MTEQTDHIPDAGKMVSPDPVGADRDPAKHPGNFLAMGLALSRPISDANRIHFAKKCRDAANELVPGLGGMIETAAQGIADAD